MRERKPLKQNSDIHFTNYAGGKMHYIVGEVIGMGGSCIVYDGYYINNAGKKNAVRIKECYPYKLHIERSEDGSLIVEDKDREKFQEYKERIGKSFEIANEFHQTLGLTNLTSNIFDRYEGNNTVYIVSSYTEGSTLKDANIESLWEALRTVISVAKCIQKIHNSGYMYLDIKAENVFKYNETPDLIQLFDFDSVVPMDINEKLTEYRISYSMGFAPVEQKMGNISQLGRHTDVYGIGALLYYLIFGNTPKTIDCGFDAIYDFEKMKWNTLYQQRVYTELTTFFHNTLQAYYKDRYQTVDEAIVQLEIIAKYANLPVPFICTGYVTNGGVVVGRQRECNEIEQWCHSDEKLLFITGMGGIGKSTIIRKFISENKENFDNLIYLKYHDSILESLADDVQFNINGFEKTEEETTREYFSRKIKVAKELTCDTNTVLIIDNFLGEMDEDFKEILHVNWKVIVITRQDMDAIGFDCRKIEALRERREQYRLFEENLNRKLLPEDHKKLDNIIDMVAGHTLILVLIARQISRSFMDIDSALKLVKNNGFSEMAPEKVRYMQDGNEHYDRVATIIKAVYDVSVLSKEKMSCLKVVSLFDIMGISVKEIKDLLKMDSLDSVNELVDSGWLELSEDNLSMHPLIQEIVHQTPWEDEDRKIALCEMEILRGRIISTNVHKEFVQVLNISKVFLLHSGKDDVLSGDTAYKELLFTTLIKSPKEYEDYIISYCEKLLGDKLYENKYNIIELYDYVVYLLCQRKDYEEALIYLDRAELFAKNSKDNYIWGLYYDMLADYYEDLLDGAYYSEDDYEIDLLDTLLLTMDKAIRYMGKCKQENAKKLYAKYVLGKAALMIRSIPEKKRRIKALITNAEKILQQNEMLDNSEIEFIYYMIWAWYYTLCEVDVEAVCVNLKEALDINKTRNILELDEIDYFYIPGANMFLELGDDENSLYFLDEACRICDEHIDEIPYIRRKSDLQEYKLEVCTHKSRK